MKPEDITKILSKLEDIEKQGANNSIRTQRIERLLIGDKDYDQKGIVHDVADAKEYIQKDKQRKAQQTGMVIGVSAASGGLIAWIKSFFA